MKETKALKYLGDFISVDASESVHQTVLKRIPIAKQAIHEIRMIVEDVRADKIGGINVAFTIWEASVLPMLLYNGETWNPKEKTKILRGIFDEFFRSIFRISSGCPQVAYYWEVGALEVRNILLQKRLMF